ncbi:MAG: hypothetical protein DRH79_07760 [Candidatus Cloacimonadota bacterium]|nr:MAG: hypothetical protein DRH79_07760 [Candidatus Cloacimonadota bacterium]
MMKRRYFYKFMPINDYTFENLSNNQIWFSSPMDFNDPFDFFIPYNLDFNKEEFEKIIPKPPGISESMYDQMFLAAKNNPTKLEKWIEIGLERFKASIKIACFCEKKNNILMWSHYADSHKGICLKFDSNFDYNFFHEDNWKFHKMPIREVKYPPKPEKAYYFKDNDNFFRACAFTKYYKWKYEKEHRIISAVDVIKYNKECLVEINFGCKCDKNNKKKIIEIINANKYPNINFKQARKSKIDFALEFDDITEMVQC